jgi:uncharacterized membrane protein
MARGEATDHALERLVFFSDAVFAIAITLLVIELHAPHLPYGAPDSDHWRALAQLIPKFVGYALSFGVIGAFWMGHHRAFGLASHYHPSVLGWNLALLGTIAFMPFAAAYMSSYLTARVPTMFYCATMFLASLFNIKVNRTATSPPMLDEEAPAESVIYVRQRSYSVALGAGTALCLSFVLPQIGQFGLASIPLWRTLLTRRRTNSAQPAE